MEIKVSLMKTSAGDDYFVMLYNEGREMSLYSFKERFKAEYTAAEMRYVMFGGEEPCILDYDENSHPNH